MAFQNIFTDGVLVDINIRKWTAERTLQPEDLGLRKEHIPKTFHLGHKLLVPKTVVQDFGRLDYEARQLLIQNSFPFAFGNARFVPKIMFKEYASRMEALKTKFNKAADFFVTNFEKYRLAVRPDYVKAATSSYDRMRKIGIAPVDREKYLTKFIERVDAFYPDVNTLRKKFAMDYVVYQVSLPDLTQVTIDDVVSDADKALLVKEVYKEALYEKIRTYVDDVVSDLRGKAKKVLDALHINLKESRRMTIASFNMVKDMVEEYERMNIIGDDTFLCMLKEFKIKHIIDNDPKKLRADEGKRRQMIAELEALSSLAHDKSSIDAVAEAYRQKIAL